jgi:hypothetical protein
MWLVGQRYMSEEFHMNSFGFAALDTIYCPMLALAFMMIVDFIPTLRTFTGLADTHQPLQLLQVQSHLPYLIRRLLGS